MQNLPTFYYLYLVFYNYLQEFASLAEHSKCDSMNVTIMSHGHEGLFYGRDGGVIHIEEMINLFNNQKCPSLQNKPKVGKSSLTLL